MGNLCSNNFEQRARGVANPETDGSNIQLIREKTVKALPVYDGKEKQLQVKKHQQKEESFSNGGIHENNVGSNLDDFYDGIPRIPRTFSQKSRSMRSTQAAVAKVSEVSSRLGRAGTMGIEKAVEVLDVLGSSMTDLNSKSGFANGVASRGTKISILAFEVANTIVKGAAIMHSLSETCVRHLKEVVLPSEGVRKLVSKDMDELLQIVAFDKREELKVFSGEVIRFGNRCKDPQWHNLDRYFVKQSKEVSPHWQLKEDAESVMQQLLTLVQYTAELYHELHALHRSEQEYQCKSREIGGSIAILREELRKQKKLVKKLKKRSLWSRSLEEIIEELVDIVIYLHLEMQNSFGIKEGLFEDANEAVEDCNHQRLGPAGLALHYANIILQIDGIVARSSSMSPNVRETLYQSLPPSIKSALRSKLVSFHVQEELTVQEIKAKMENTLQWLVPIASNTVKCHHGFGWVGEWATSGSEANHSAAQTDVIRVETLYHADKLKTEAYITDQLLWLHHLVSQSRVATIGFGTKPPTKTLHKKHETEHKALNSTCPAISPEEQEMLNDASEKKPFESEDLDSVEETSSGQSLVRGGNEETVVVNGGLVDCSGEIRKSMGVIEQVGVAG